MDEEGEEAAVGAEAGVTGLSNGIPFFVAHRREHQCGIALVGLQYLTQRRSGKGGAFNLLPGSDVFLVRVFFGRAESKE